MHDRSVTSDVFTTPDNACESLSIPDDFAGLALLWPRLDEHARRTLIGLEE